jgi:hypothetical protein
LLPEQSESFPWPPPEGDMKRKHPIKEGDNNEGPSIRDRKGRQYSLFKILFAGTIIFIHYITDQEKVQFSLRKRVSEGICKLNNAIKLNI